MILIFVRHSGEKQVSGSLHFYPIGNGRDKGCFALAQNDRRHTLSHETHLSHDAYDSHKGVRGHLLNRVTVFKLQMSHFKVWARHQLCHALTHARLIKHLVIADIEIEGLACLLHVQLPQIAIGVTAVVVPHAIGDVAGLLNLYKQVTSADGMNLASWDEESITRLGLGGIYHVKNRSICQPAVKFLKRNRAVETRVDNCPVIGLKNVPHLVLTRTSMTTTRHFVIGVHLNGQVSFSVNELNQQGKLIAIAAIDIITHEVSAITLNQLGECQASVIAISHY